MLLLGLLFTLTYGETDFLKRSSKRILPLRVWDRKETERMPGRKAAADMIYYKPDYMLSHGGVICASSQMKKDDR